MFLALKSYARNRAPVADSALWSTAKISIIMGTRRSQSERTPKSRSGHGWQEKAYTRCAAASKYN
jgi:hypothetical protein